jgi:hypothetical protein
MSNSILWELLVKPPYLCCPVEQEAEEARRQAERDEKRRQQGKKVAA